MNTAEGAEGAGKASHRGPSAAAIGKKLEFKDAREAIENRLIGQYRAKQMEIAQLERDVQRGIEHMQKQTDSEILKISKGIGRETLEKIENLKAEKEILEQDMRAKGLKPEDHTVQ